MTTVDTAETANSRRDAALLIELGERAIAALQAPPPLADWTDITIRPTYEVRCPTHGVIGHDPSATNARVIRGRHWHEQHRNRPVAGGVQIDNQHN